MLRFTFVGALAFLIDSSALYLGMALGLNLFTGRLFSWLVAASGAWFCHRRFTFQLDTRPHFLEWLRFIGTNAIGGAVNLGLYSVLILSSDLFRRFPPLAIGIGATVAFGVNYALSELVVFNTKRSRPDTKNSSAR